jgi:regulator of chromosome condensation
VYVFGEGSAGELGLGPKDATDVTRPRLNNKVDAEKVGVVDIAAGGMHAVALAHDSKVLTWGVNDNHALGRETSWEGGLKDIDDAQDDASWDDSDGELNPYESTPSAIPVHSFAPGTKIVRVTAGDSASFALTEQGLVYGWGTFVVSEAWSFWFTVWINYVIE